MQHHTTDIHYEKMLGLSALPTGFEIEHSKSTVVPQRYDAFGVKDRHLMQSNMNNAVDESVHKTSPTQIQRQSDWSPQSAAERPHHHQRSGRQEILSPPNKVKRWYANETQRLRHSHTMSQLSEKEKRWRKIQRFHARNKGHGLSSELLKLVGAPLLPPLRLSDRGFSDWHNTSRIASLLPNLHGHIASESTLNDKVRALSLNPDIVARGHVSIIYH